MRWANFFHIYQPAGQQPDILESIVVQSYLPILSGLQKNKNARITLNITGALLELFDNHSHHKVIDLLRKLGKKGQIEFTGSAKYHAFLPFLNEAEILRQIRTNNETCQYYLGDSYKPRGFFPPEMGYDPKLVPIIESEGFDWVIIDEIAHSGEIEKVDYNKTYKIKNSNLRVFFRERHLSNLIMSAVVRSVDSLLLTIKKELKSDRYVLTAMDGETFGHHRPGLEKMLIDIFSSEKLGFVTISDLLDLYKEEVEIEPIASTWASSKQDIDENIQFISWADPENPIHGWQRELVDLALSEVNSLSEKSEGYKNIRKKMDAGLSSDHFWWASAKPWWSVEMIELGSHNLLEIIRSIPNIKNEKLRRAIDLYEKIISTSFEWQRTGKIREMMKRRNDVYRIPFKERTWGLGDVGGATYRAFLDMMGSLEKKAALRGEYEKAILWRDAIWRMDNKTDIYEAINAIDLLRKEIPNEEVDKIVDKYRSKYKKLRGGQPEDRV